PRYRSQPGDLGPVVLMLRLPGSGNMCDPGRPASRHRCGQREPAVVGKGGPAVKLGLHYWNYSTPSDPAAIAATLAETARIAEQAGLSTVTVMDHYFHMEGM